MSKLEQYGHNFQIKTLSSLLKDKEFLQQVADIVSPDFFDNEANKWIVSKTLEYFNEFRTTPTMEVFKVEVEKIRNEIQQVAVKEQLKESNKKPIVLPKTDEELETWMAEYPDVAAMVETIATKKAREQSEDLEDRVTKINKMQDDAERQKAETLLLQIHPDFEDIRDDDQFHAWAEEQPKWVQQALYDNDNDAKAAARAIDLYKSDFNIGPKKKQSNGDAAEMISSKQTRTRPTNDDSEGVILESTVQKMSMDQYAKNQEAIMEAMNKGTFIYDISGSAR